MKTGYSFGSLVSFVEALNAAAVKITGDQTIAGLKTFSSNPITSAAQGSGGGYLTRKDYVDGALALKAPLASPALTGVPTAPTAAAGTNTTQIATTAFVQTAKETARTTTYTVANEAAMLALANAKKGDVAIRSDLNNRTFILYAEPYSTLLNWKVLAENVVISDFAKTLLDDADAAAMHNTLGIADLEPRISNNESKVFEALRRSYADAGYTLVNGSFEKGGTLTDATDVLLYNLSGKAYLWTGAYPKVVAPGTDPALSGSGYVPRTNIVLRGELASDEGAGILGFSHSETYESATVGEKLKQVVAITDAPFLGVSGADTTAALDAAALAAEFIFLPPGVWSTTNSAFAYWKCYGQGTLIVAGEFAEVQPMPQNGRTLKVYKKRTFGWRENACAMSTVANAKFEQTKENTQINGASTSHMASTYMSQDHVGVYGASYNFAAVVTTAASTTYTATSITAPEITEANCVVGMYLRTKHATKYLGKVTAVNYNTKTATVDGWWTWGGGIVGTPANGTGTEINPNDKIWALNHNLVLESSGDANKGSGFELGLTVNKSGAGANVWGYDCITLASSETPYAHFISRGAKTHAFLALTGGIYGFASEANQVSFESKDPTIAAFRATVGGVVKWAVNASGTLERDYRKFKAINQASYSIEVDDCFLVNVYGSATITLPAGATVGANRVFTIKANALCTVKTASGMLDGASSRSMAAGSYNQFICDGNNWYAF